LVERSVEVAHLGFFEHRPVCTSEMKCKLFFIISQKYEIFA
jgi:hypothetical protein